MLAKQRVWVNSCEWPQVDAGLVSVRMPYQLGDRAGDRVDSVTRSARLGSQVK